MFLKIQIEKLGRSVNDLLVRRFITMRPRLPASRSKENRGLTSVNRHIPAKAKRVAKEPPQRYWTATHFRPGLGNGPSEEPKRAADSIDHSLRYLLKQCESKRVRRNYMSSQRSITAEMRAILVDWMVDVSQKFKLLPQTLFMAVGLLDRFLSLGQVEQSKLQLVGITCVMIIGKYEEIFPPTVKDYVEVCDDVFTPQELLEAEGEVLLTLNFDLNLAVSYVMLEFFRHFICLDEREFALCHFLLESSLLDLEHLDYSAAVLAAGTILLAKAFFQKAVWGKKEESITKISFSVAKEAARFLFAVGKKLEALDLNAVKDKFSSPKYFGISGLSVEQRIFRLG